MSDIRAIVVRGVLAAILVGAPASAVAQVHGPGTENGEWRYLGGDSWHTRYSPADQITPENFDQLEMAWQWNSGSFGPSTARATPSYVDGRLITVAGSRRYVVGIDPASGETLWTYREPDTQRFEYSMRQGYGKGVAYDEIDGRPVVFVTTPGFFLHALDAETGVPLENWGTPVPIDGVPQTGVVDMLADLGHEYDPYEGIPLETGYITTSSPPIVVNGVVIVGNSAEQGYNQSRVENVPGDILGYDAATGEFLWKFDVIPGPGEFGHETWENDAWKWTGDVSSWAPMSADLERGIVYVPTNGATIDFYGGFRPGDNLFSTSLIALDARTGKRVWHQQLVHHDIWNYDTPTAPVLMDVRIDGERVPIVAQATKQGFVYTFNRETGEPIWPIVERPVPQSLIPGEKLSPTQPFPTRPAPFEMQGLAIDDLIDFTPELRQQAIETIGQYDIGPLFQPPLHVDNDLDKIAALWCPGDSGGANIDGPAVADPTTGILYVTSRKACTTHLIVPGEVRDAENPNTTGTTIVDYAVGGSVRPIGPGGLPLYKPPYSRITAIDMNTGEHLWWIPVGDTPDRISNHPLLEGVDVGNTGTGSPAPMAVTATMLLAAAEGSDGASFLYALDKWTGERLGQVEIPSPSRYGMSTFVHEGRQFILVQLSDGLAAYALPDRASAPAAGH